MEARYILLFTVLVLFCLCFPSRKRRYRRTSYYRMTKVPYGTVMRDKGRFGEYQIYRKLASYEKKDAEFLFNCYLPKSSGETTEIDAVMLHTSGIYVFESKNYSGQVFGREGDRMWTQTLKNESGFIYKKQFLNPLLQNQSHIVQMKRHLGLDEEIPVYSIVVFSDRCIVKKMTVSDINRQVTTWKKLRHTVRKFAGRQPEVLDRVQIEEWYDRLYPYTQVSKREKQEHIRNIQRHQRESEVFSPLFRS